MVPTKKTEERTRYVANDDERSLVKLRLDLQLSPRWAKASELDLSPWNILDRLECGYFQRTYGHRAIEIGHLRNRW